MVGRGGGRGWYRSHRRKREGGRTREGSLFKIGKNANFGQIEGEG